MDLMVEIRICVFNVLSVPKGYINDIINMFFWFFLPGDPVAVVRGGSHIAFNKHRI
jgi:hypothetical protein